MERSDKMEWEVWLADGRRLTSEDSTWAEVPDGILVQRYWGTPGKGVNWGDGLYGRPDTLKAAGMTDDEVFASVLVEAKASKIPPSER